MYTTDIKLSYRLLLSLHSIIAVSVNPFLINLWANIWIFLKNRINEIRSNEIRMRREPSVYHKIYF